jgi:hypothetical protein
MSVVGITPWREISHEPSLGTSWVMQRNAVGVLADNACGKADGVAILLLDSRVVTPTLCRRAAEN